MNNTILSYDNDLKKIESYYNKKDLLKLNVNDLIKYISVLSDLAPSTVSHNISTLKAFYNYFLKVGKIKTNPTDALKSPRVVTHLPVYLTKEGVDTYVIVDIKEQIENEKNKAALKLMHELNNAIQSGEEEGWLQEEDIRQFLNNKYNE